jgi:hypothetical protein
MYYLCSKSSLMNPGLIQAGKPATGIHFVGREEELKIIARLLSMGQSVVLVAPRRFGKTSLVLELLRKLKTVDRYTAYVDVFASPTLELLSAQIVEAVLRNHKLDRFFTKSRKSAMAMIKNLGLKSVIEDFEFILGFSENRPDEWGLLQDSINFIDRFAVKHKKTMVCAFDEFGDVEKLDGDKIVKLFRSLVQVQQQTGYIFSGSYESVMNTMFIRKNSPFFRFARVFYLDFIPKEKFIRYFRKTLASREISMPDQAMKEVLDFTGGHPYYSQLALQMILIDFLVKGSVPGLESIKTGMLNAERGYLEKTWEDLSSSRETVKVLLALVEHERGLYGRLGKEHINVSRGLSQLSRKGIILKTGNHAYKLSDPLFKHWLRENITRGSDS